MKHSKTFFETFAELLTVKTLEEWKEKSDQFVRLLGFDLFLYGIKSGVPGKEPDIISTYPSAWRATYDSNQYMLHDPTVSHCVHSFLPLIWSPELYQTRSQKEIYEEACDYDIRSGVSIPIRSFQDKLGMISFANGGRMCKGESQISSQLMPELSLLVAYMHEAYIRLEQPEETPRLTPRERECLKWIASGKTTWEVSRIMNCSERTVTFHVSNITSKLGVSNRQHAVARAVSLSLI
ncbi:MAG TPA: LuxR family transcriptional regulator [Gammaproteobacteria bacterium]